MKQALRLAALLLALWIPACAPDASSDPGRLGSAVATAIESGTRHFDNSNFNKILSSSVKGGLVDYRTLARERAALDDYLEAVAAAPLSQLAKNDAFALLINAYNALTLREILDHPGVTSIREIPDVWKRADHRVGGFACSLDQLEHNVLRPLFRDARVHFAINCASRSCAPLAPYAFSGAELERQLDERRSAFIKDPAQVRAENGVLKLSSYFDWFRADFTTPGWRDAAPSVIAYIRPFATPAVQALIDTKPQLKILPYDWSLNALEPPVDEDNWLARQAKRVRRLTSGYGAAGAALFGLLYAVAVVCLVPAGPLTIAAGAAYGLAGGFAVVSIASTSAAVVAFLIARHLLRERVRGWLARWPSFGNVDRAIEQGGWKIVALARLSPVMPYSALNYALGVTGVGLVPYAVASWLATMPGTLLYVAMGAVSVDVATGGASTGLKIAGVVATSAAIWWLTRAATGKLTGSAPPSA